MHDAFDPDRFRAAARRFREFFEELSEAYLEREDALVQFQLALLAREHVLMTGPPGTGKSQMAAAVLRRIVDEGTGEPSVFARQFTENTVNTDLVGPIDFKTLMESGRTEHFTDEGILGAVHAFLDEVFDGRDMLLRSTLELLHERELKHGSVTTRGRIEAAFMTSNRYIAEILDSARETLLAFLDRVAFVTFVPRGFADPKSFVQVVRRHGGGFGRRRLGAPLSIQDLDVLQAAVARTFVPEALCDGLARLLSELDAEQAAAMRADRSFQPTRYLSTRSAIRAAQVVRAAAVRAVIFGRERPWFPSFMAHWDDLAALRYNLVLSGLSRERAGALLEHETDPRERRQLDIMRTEAEMFERCLAKVPRAPLPDAVPSMAPAELEALVGRARDARDPAELVAAAHALARAADSGVGGADQAARQLIDTVGVLSERALAAGLWPELAGAGDAGAGARTGGAGVGDTGDAGDIGALARRLSGTADALERAVDGTRPLACWVRGRLLGLIDESLRLSSTLTPESVTLLLAQPARAALEQRIGERLAAMEAIHAVRRQLEVGGAWLEDAHTSQAAWHMAVARLEQEIALLWDARFRAATTELLAAADTRPLSRVLAELAPHLQALERDVERLARLGPVGELKKSVVGPRIEPLVAAAVGRMRVTGRKQVVAEIEAVVRELGTAGLSELIDPARFVEWTAPALLLAERARADEPAAPVRDLSSYRAAMAGEDPLSLVQTLVEIALRVVPRSALEPEHPELSSRAVWSVVRSIRTEVAREVAELELGRVERGVRRLQEWWAHLGQDRDGARADAGAGVGLLERAVGSGFLRVMRSPETVRLALEARNLGEVFPDQADRANGLRKRLRRLDEDATGLMVELLQKHAESAWDDALGPRDPGA